MSALAFPPPLLLPLALPNFLAQVGQRLTDNLSYTPQRLQIFHTVLKQEEVVFIHDMLTKHACIKTIQMLGATFDTEQDAILFCKLLKNSALTSLFIIACPALEGVMQCLAACVQETRLRRLELVRCQISDAGATHLANALFECYSLATLNLRQNCITSAGGMALGSKLSASSIVNLDLGANALGDDAICAIARALPQTYMCELVLDNTEMTQTGFTALCDGMQHCPTLEIVSVNGNTLGNASLECLAKALPACVALKQVRFGGNAISALSNEFARALAQHARIESLSLRGNRDLDDKAVLEFTRVALASHASLQTLNLNDTLVSPETREYILRKLQALHDGKSQLLVALVSARTSRRLGFKSLIAHHLPMEMLRQLKDML